MLIDTYWAINRNDGWLNNISGTPLLFATKRQAESYIHGAQLTGAPGYNNARALKVELHWKIENEDTNTD